MRRALLTGATGFIGSHLLLHLHAAGWNIAAIARSPAVDFLSHNPAISQVYEYRGETSEVMKALAEYRPDVVLHLSSHFLATHDSTQVESLVTSNILFGTQILEAMKAADVTAIVNAGTGWQNFDGEHYNPVNLYAATKQAFEDILAFYTATTKLRAVTLRLFDSYGPKDQRRKLLRLLVDSMTSNQHLEMSPGEQLLDLVHVDDICRAFLGAADLALAQQPGASVYAVSSGRRYTLRQVVSMLEDVAGRKLKVEFGARPYRDREVMNPWMGRSLPGWQPRIGLQEGLRSLLVDEAHVHRES